MALNTSTAVVFHLIQEESSIVDNYTSEVILGVGALEDILSIIGLALLPALILSTTVTLESVAIFVCEEDGVTKKAGCSGLVTAPVESIFKLLLPLT